MLAAATLRSHDAPFIHDDYLQEGKSGMLHTPATMDLADAQNLLLDYYIKSTLWLNRLHWIVPLTGSSVCS